VKKVILAAFAVCIGLTSCAGYTGNPIMVSQMGDERRSCKALEIEIQNTQQQMQRLAPDTDKSARNVALGITGLFLIVPWFFMDFKDGEKTEYDAYRERYEHLTAIAADRDCDVNPAKAKAKK
jgi:hypothetical protein